MASNRNGNTALSNARCEQSAHSPSSARWPTILLLAGYGAGFGLASQPAPAQGQKPSATINVSPQLRLSPGTESKLEISVAPGDAIPPRALIVIRGVPTGLQLSEARLFGPGVWVIQATQITTIKLHIPAETHVSGDLTVALTTLEGISIAEAHITLLTPPPGPEQAGKAGSPPAGVYDTLTSATVAHEQQTTPIPKPTADNRPQLLILLEKGKDSARHGNILHARQFYQRAAERGLAEAAFALAATYDAGELSRMKGVAGVVPDVQLARKWYEKALQLGSPDAAARLSALRRP